jgi:acyl-CoA reductase-like NAD-dependent aldehyde dehydrogenase
MDSEILAKIVAAEREIQKGLEAEELAAARMLEELRQELDRRSGHEEEALAAERGKALAGARREAAEKTRQTIAEARQKARRLAELPAALLERHVLRHIVGIIPER